MTKSFSPCLAALAVVALSACKVPGPPPAFVYPAPPPPSAPAAEKEAARWFGDAVPEPDAAGAPLADRPARNSDSPLGANLPSLDAGYPLFANRFRQATPWAARARRGRKKQALAVDQDGQVTRLQRGQFASTTLSLLAGTRYILSWEGSGRLALEGVRDEERLGSNRRAFVAVKNTVGLRLERTSPSVPVRDVSVVPASLDAADPTPRFDPDFLNRIEGFSVLRFSAGTGWNGAWADRTRPEAVTQSGPGGVAFEHLFDLARQIEADAWLVIPLEADADALQGLAQMARARLHATGKLFVEYGEETWRTPDRLSRLGEVFAPFEAVLGADRVVRVVAVPTQVEPTKALLEASGGLASVDALAVAPELALDGNSAKKIESEVLPSLRVELKALAELAAASKLRLLAYRGGLSTKRSALARNPNAGVLVGQVLSAWREAGGELFVVGPLFGSGRAISRDAVAVDRGPQLDAFAQFREAQPRWWKEARPAAAPAEVPPPVIAEAPPTAVPDAALAAAPPPPERLYTAPWAKWVSFGAAVVVGGFGAERLIAARDFESNRDNGITSLRMATEAQAFDELQDVVRGADGDRELAEILGFTAVGVSAALIGWGIFQWLDEPPSPEVVIPSWADGAESREPAP